MAMTDWAVNMSSWVTGQTGVIVAQANALVGGGVAPSEGLYSRLDILKATSERILLHENAVVEKSRVQTSIDTGLLDSYSLDAANAKVTQLTQYISYIETYVLLDFIKYPTIAIT